MTRLTSAEAHLARRLGLFDITMIVMGGIIGAGIFITPYIVAQQVPSTILILGAWAFGGLVALAVLTIINCFGVRAGSTTQNLFMILKLIAIAALVLFGLSVTSAPPSALARSTSSAPTLWNSLTAFGAALIPVQFAYGGWQTSCFVAGEVREPQKNLPRGLLLGVLGVIAVYLSVSFVCVHALGPVGLSQTKIPASSVMQLALGENGARIIAAGIAVSTIGFLSQSMLTTPRVYFAMAEDGLFFASLAKLNRARVPAFAIALQGAVAILITFSGRYEQILNYVVSVDVIFFALTAGCVFVFRHRRKTDSPPPAASPMPVQLAPPFRVPGHPVTTLFFIVACCAMLFSTVYRYPHNSLIGLGIMLTGLPAYLFWKTRRVPIQ